MLQNTKIFAKYQEILENQYYIFVLSSVTVMANIHLQNLSGTQENGLY